MKRRNVCCGMVIGMTMLLGACGLQEGREMRALQFDIYKIEETQNTYETEKAQENREPEDDLIDYYQLTSDQQKKLPQKMIEGYADFVSAVLNHDDTLEYDTRRYAKDDWRGIYTVFYDVNPLGAFVEQIEIWNGCVNIKYRYTEEEHKRELAWFEHEIQRIMEEIVPENADELETVLSVYHYFASQYEYDYDYDPEGGADILMYDFLKNGKGVCHSYSRSCAFVLSQLGLEAISIRGFSANGDFHEWFAASIDGSWYQFDPTYENGSNGGTGLMYFGMTDAQRYANDGYERPFYAGTYPYDQTAPACLSERFSPLWKVYDSEPQGDHLWRILPMDTWIEGTMDARTGEIS